MRFLGPSIGFLMLVLATAGPSTEAAAAPIDSTLAGTSLAASTAPPWIPPTPVAAATPWESALRLPGRILSLPLVALGFAVETSLIRIEDANVVYKVLGLFMVQRRVGLAVVPTSRGDRTGFGGEVSWAPPGFRRRLLTEISGTLRQYNRERVHFLAGPVRALYASEWRSRDQYFGTGLSTTYDGRSSYGELTQYARLTVSLPQRTVVPGAARAVDGALVNPTQLPPQPPPRTNLYAWAGPRDAFMTYGRDPAMPSFEVAHPAEAAGSLHQRVEHFTYGAHISYDARYGRPHWTGGWRAMVEAERFDRSIEALALTDAHTDARSFTRLSYVAEGGVSFGHDPRTLRLLIRAVDQRLDDAGGTFLIADLMTLGASAGDAGFDAGRFHDVDLVVGKLTYIYPLGKNFEFDIHAETGGVYPDFGGARIASLRNSFGAALRIRTEFAVFARVGIDVSSEQWRFRVSLVDLE